MSAALVTGGSRGLGRVAAAALTGAGHRVAVTGRDAGALRAVVDAGDAALALPGDATSPADVVAAVAACGEDLDLVVANAGSFAAGGRLWEGDPDLWWRDVEVNLRGVHLLLWACLPGMVARGHGRVLVLGSGFGTAPTAGATAYASSKAAVARLVDSAAAELAGTGVTLLTTSPGMVRTDMTEQFPEGFLQLRPDLRDPAPEQWASADAYAAFVVRFAGGDLDAFAGRYLRVRDDADALRGRLEDEAAGTLRVTW